MWTKYIVTALRFLNDTVFKRTTTNNVVNLAGLVLLIVTFERLYSTFFKNFSNKKYGG